MPNKNYQAGRRFEYDTRNEYKSAGWTVLRTAGSHGPYDLVAFSGGQKPDFVQCKVVTTQAEADRLRKAFVDTTRPERFFDQTLTVKIKGTKVPQSVTVSDE